MDATTTGTNETPHEHESVATSLIIYSTIFLLVNILVVALRFHVRLRILRKFGGDDIALAITLVRVWARFCLPRSTVLTRL